jgi:hypothetical protein
VGELGVRTSHATDGGDCAASATLEVSPSYPPPGPLNNFAWVATAVSRRVNCAAIEADNPLIACQHASAMVAVMLHS